MNRLPVRLAVAAVAGAALFLSCPSFDLWPLMWVAMAPLAGVALGAKTHKRAFLIGWLGGLVGNTGGFYWMKNLLERFGHLPAAAAIPIMLLLTSYQGLEFAFWTWGVRRAHQRTGLPFIVLAPVVMVVIELVMPMIFPFYLAISQAWVLPVIQIADLTGPLGVTALLLMVNGALVDAARRRRRGAAWAVALRPVGLAAAVVVLCLGYGAVRLHQVAARREAAPRAKVGLVQANIGILEKWDPANVTELLSVHQELSRQLAAQGADLIVWPESSYPYPLPRDVAQDFPDDDRRKVRRGWTTPMVFGTVTHRRPVRTPMERYPYNTAFMMDAEGRITGGFDKVFLMMFGEYIPFFEYIPWFQRVFPEASEFNHGRDPASFPFRLRGRDYKLGPLICYEDILPGFSRQVARLGPNLFVNITNDAWFGKSSEPWQHLALAVFRTVEHRIEMVRAVNTGVSVHVDATGKVRHATPSVDPAEVPRPEPVASLVEVALLDPGTVYGVLGDLFGWACLGLLAAGLWRPRLVRRLRESPDA